MTKSNLKAYFGDNGYFAKQHPEFRRRPEQEAMAREIEKAIQEGKSIAGKSCAILPVQGETGIGKSLASLIPVLHQIALHKQQKEAIRGAYSTFTTQLRAQLAAKDLPRALAAVESVTGTKLVAAEYHGAASYLSPRSIRRYSEEAKGEGKKKAKTLLSWLTEKNDGLLASAKEFLGVPETDPLINGIADEEWVCTWREASELPAYQRMRKAVQEADFILLSHAALLSNAMRRFRMFRSDEHGEIRYAIMDEAHKIHDAAKALGSRTVSIHRLASVLDDMIDTFPESGISREVVNNIKKLAATLSDLGHKKRKPGHVFLSSEIIGQNDSRTLTDVLTEHRFSDTVKKLDKAKRKLWPFDISDQDFPLYLDFSETVEDLWYLNWAFQGKGNARSSAFGVAFSESLHHPSLVIQPVEPGRLVSSYWKELADPKETSLWTAIILSATIPSLPQIGIFGTSESAGEGENAIKLLCESIHTYPVFEPRDFGKMQFVLSGKAPRTMAEEKGRKNEDNERWTNTEWETGHLLPMIDAMMEQSSPQEGSLILSPSAVEVTWLAEQMKERGYGQRLCVHAAGQTLAQTIKNFLSKPGQVLLSAGGWEGLDLPGAFQNILITRIPYSPVDPFYEEILLDRYDEQKAKGIIWVQRREDASTKLRQGVGRGIRRPEDSVTIWIADPRFGLPKRIVQLHDPRVGIEEEIPDHLRKAIPKRFNISLEKAKVFTAKNGVFTPRENASSRKPKTMADSLLERGLPHV